MVLTKKNTTKESKSGTSNRIDASQTKSGTIQAHPTPHEPTKCCTGGYFLGSLDCLMPKAMENFWGQPKSSKKILPDQLRGEGIGERNRKHSFAI